MDELRRLLRRRALRGPRAARRDGVHHDRGQHAGHAGRRLRCGRGGLEHVRPIRLPGGSVGSNILPVGTDSTCTAGTYNWGEPLRTASGAITLVPGCKHHFPIIYSDGNLVINGNGRGQGILLINGDLKINGTFDFYGIVIARDDVERGTGTANIYGAVFSRNADVGDNSFWSGTQNVNYSQCAIENALRGSAILTRVGERHWTQLY